MTEDDVDGPDGVGNGPFRDDREADRVRARRVARRQRRVRSFPAVARSITTSAPRHASDGACADALHRPEIAHDDHDHSHQTSSRLNPATSCRSTAAPPVVFERGEGCRLFDAAGRALPGLHLGHRRRGARARPSAPRGSDCRAGARADPHVEPVLPSAAGRAGGAALGALGTRARILLQQRHGSGRGVPEVRAPLLARRGRTANAVRRVRALVPRPNDGRAVGDLGRRTTARRSRRSCRT